MRKSVGGIIEAGLRVADFAAAHPVALPAVEEERAWLDSLIAKARVLIQAEQDGYGTFEGAVSIKAQLRAQIYDELQIVRGIADTAGAREPGVEPRIRLPGREAGERKFITGARMAIRRARGREASLLRFGLAEGQLDALEAQVARFEASIADKRAGNATHVLANASLLDVAEEIRDSLRHFDSLYRRPFRADPDLQAAYQRARALPKRKETPLPDTGTTGK